MSALFDSASDRTGLVHALTELEPELAPEQISFRIVEDQDQRPGDTLDRPSLTLDHRPLERT